MIRYFVSPYFLHYLWKSTYILFWYKCFYLFDFFEIVCQLIENTSQKSKYDVSWWRIPFKIMHPMRHDPFYIITPCIIFKIQMPYYFDTKQNMMSVDRRYQSKQYVRWVMGHVNHYRVATINGLLEIIGLFCKRAL